MRTDIRIDISISIGSMANKFGKQVHTSRGIGSNETSQAGAGDVITSRSLDKLKPLYLYYHSTFGHPTWQDFDKP